MISRAQGALSDRVASVRKSTRLTDSPACLVFEQFDMPHQVTRAMRASGQAMPVSKPHLEINLDHALIRHLAAEEDEGKFNDIALVVFDHAALADGFEQPRSWPVRPARQPSARRLDRIAAVRVAVVGAGNFGTVIANIVAGNGIVTSLYTRDQLLLRDMTETRENHRYLPNHRLHDNVKPTSDFDTTISTARLGVCRRAQRFVSRSIKSDWAPDSTRYQHCFGDQGS